MGTTGANSVPVAWTCDPSSYGASDGCDCGWGIVDPDCQSAAASACQDCAGCTDDFECTDGLIDPTDNALCVAGTEGSTGTTGGSTGTVGTTGCSTGTAGTAGCSTRGACNMDSDCGSDQLCCFNPNTLGSPDVETCSSSSEGGAGVRRFSRTHRRRWSRWWRGSFAARTRHRESA